MNKQELRAMLLIAKKLHWNGKPAEMVILTIKDMVIEQQYIEMARYNDCDGAEETLLSMGTWEPGRLLRLKRRVRQAALDERTSWIINNCWS